MAGARDKKDATRANYANHAHGGAETGEVEVEAEEMR